MGYPAMSDETSRNDIAYVKKRVIVCRHVARIPSLFSFLLPILRAFCASFRFRYIKVRESKVKSHELPVENAYTDNNLIL